MRPIKGSFLERTIDNQPKGAGGFRMLPNVGHCTDEMAHAMSRLDGYDRDRDMPTLQRWIADLRRNLRHWREECGKLHSKPISSDHGPNCGCHYCT